MRKIIFLFALLAICSSVSAQLGMKKTRIAAKTPEFIANLITTNLNSKLNFTDAQKTSVTNLVVESVKQVRTINSEMIDAKAKSLKIDQLTKDHKSKLRALLTTAQIKLVESLKKKSSPIVEPTNIPAEDAAAAFLKQVLE